MEPLQSARNWMNLATKYYVTTVETLDHEARNSSNGRFKENTNVEILLEGIQQVFPEPSGERELGSPVAGGLSLFCLDIDMLRPCDSETTKFRV